MITESKSLFLFFVLFSSSISAQGSLDVWKKIDTTPVYKITHSPKWEGGLFLGLTAYAGDLEFAFAESRPILGLFVRRSLGNYFGMNISLAQGILSGSDKHSTATPWRLARNFAFKSPLTELVVRGEYHFLGITHKVASLSSGVSVMDEGEQKSFRMRARRISPFIYVGGGLAIVSPKTNFNDKLLPNPTTAGFRINADKSASHAKAHVVVPFGGGLRIPFANQQTFLTMEGGFRPTFSDEIDGISVSGNPNVDDWYLVSSIGLSKTLGFTKDSDKDGIPDKYDLCPFLKGDAKLQGCPDRDGDGITDDKDACPNASGLVIYEGCPDTDGDGIIDKYDICPNEVGIGRYRGCPTEQKLISSANDSTKNKPLTSLDTVKIIIEPNTQALKPVDITQTAGKKDSLTLNNNFEKPVIAENTPPQYIPEKPITKPTELPINVIDTTISRTEKPVTVITKPVEVPQYQADKPITKPTEKPITVVDTTISKADKPIAVVTKPLATPQYQAEKPIKKPIESSKPVSEPTVLTPEKPIGIGKTQQPINSYLENATVLDTLSMAFNIVRNHYTIKPIFFETSKADYKPEALALLDEVAYIMLENPAYKLRIIGHTDITGKASSNQVLSVNRAKMCYVYLQKKGVPTKQMSYKGLGQTQPAADNDTEEGRQLNRRVEFEIKDR